jgi:hypothetical protein
MRLRLARKISFELRALVRSLERQSFGLFAGSCCCSGFALGRYAQGSMLISHRFRLSALACGSRGVLVREDACLGGLGCASVRCRTILGRRFSSTIGFEPGNRLLLEKRFRALELARCVQRLLLGCSAGFGSESRVALCPRVSISLFLCSIERRSAALCLRLSFLLGPFARIRSGCCFALGLFACFDFFHGARVSGCAPRGLFLQGSFRCGALLCGRGDLPFSLLACAGFRGCALLGREALESGGFGTVLGCEFFLREPSRLALGLETAFCDGFGL